MPTKESYDNFKVKLFALEEIDLTTQTIKRNLQIKNKPTSCLGRFFSIFHSRGKEADLAIRVLTTYMAYYEKNIKEDEDAEYVLSIAELVSREIQKNLVNGEKALQNGNLRKVIDRKCIDLQKGCEKLRLKLQENSFQTPSPKVKKKPFPKVSTFDDLKNVLKKIKVKSLSIGEATNLLLAMDRILSKNTLDKNRDKNLANDLLLIGRQIKIRFNSFQDNNKLKEAYVKFQSNILYSLFNDRINQDSQDLEALRRTFNQSTWLDGNKKSTINAILSKMEQRNIKGRPIAYPKWFHCTKTKFINPILSSKAIEVRAVAKKGAFVASTPNYLNYGRICLAFSKDIEQPISPSFTVTCTSFNSLTNVYYSDQSRYKNTKPLYPHYPRTFDIRTPNVWIGHQQNIHFQKADKKTNIVDYYQKTALCCVTDFGSVFNDRDNFKLTEKNIDFLTNHKVHILHPDDFTAFIYLIQDTFHFTVPPSWKRHIENPV